MANEKVLGYADFGAYMHRNEGGTMKIAAYTSVNKPLSVEAHDETTKIAQRRYKIVEEERAELDGNKFYQKDVWNVQEETGKDIKPTVQNNNKYVPTGEHSCPAPINTPMANGELTPLAVLKNFVDNIAADNRMQWLAIAGIALMIMLVAVGVLLR